MLAHSSPSVVGMVTRKGDTLAPYQATMTSAPNGFYNGGAFVSPASGQLIFNLRMSITDDAGTPIGLVGGGPFLAGLNDLLSKMTISGMEQEKYFSVGRQREAVRSWERLSSEEKEVRL